MDQTAVANPIVSPDCDGLPRADRRQQPRPPVAGAEQRAALAWHGIETTA
jgi:hypothetical protein